MGHLRVTVGHPWVTIGHFRATMGHLRLTIGYLKAIVVHIRVTLGHLKVTIGNFFSELHPKVRPTCLSHCQFTQFSHDLWSCSCLFHALHPSLSLSCVTNYRYFQIVELLVYYPEREMKDIVEETLTDEETEDPH